MELRLVAGECKDRRDPLALFFLDILGCADTSLHLYLGEGGFPWTPVPMKSSLHSWAPQNQPPLTVPPQGWHRGSAGWPPLAGKALCFHSQSVSIRIREKREMQFFWCQTGRKTQQSTGGNEAVMHKASWRQWELGHFCIVSLKQLTRSHWQSRAWASRPRQGLGVPPLLDYGRRGTAKVCHSFFLGFRSSPIGVLLHVPLTGSSKAGSLQTVAALPVRLQQWQKSWQENCML